MFALLLAFDAVLTPGDWFTWIIVGLIAGFLASMVIRGSGYGILGDILVGLAGAIIGGWLVGVFFPGYYGFWSSILISFIGACILIAVLRLFSRGRSTTSGV